MGPAVPHEKQLVGNAITIKIPIPGIVVCMTGFLIRIVNMVVFVKT